MKTNPKPAERFAQRIIQQELGRRVNHHDDNSQPSLYDLRIGNIDAPEVAIECVGAVDRVLTEAWNLGPAQGPFSLKVQGDWRVTMTRGAKVRDLRSNLEPLLRQLERLRISFLDVDYPHGRDERHLIQKMRALRLSEVCCFRNPGTGEVHLDAESIGGVVDEFGRSVSGWIGEFLRSPERADVLHKLSRSGALARHVFVLVDFAGAPWEVESYLGRPIQHLPQTQPDLPESVTGVWIASTHGPNGVFWTDSQWRTFDVADPDGA